MKERFLSIFLTLCMVLTLLNGVKISASAASTWDGIPPAVNASYAFSGGTGTSADPYLISNAADLAQLAVNINAGTNYTNKVFVQTADIDLNSGVTFTFVADTGLVTVTNGTNTFYLGTGIKGDASGGNTVFDTTAGTVGAIYSDTAGTAGADTIGLHPWTPIGKASPGFMGYFKGQSFTVRGIYINTSSDYKGLFGYNSGSVSNVGVVNSYIRGMNYVGGVTGYGDATNCYNTGTICGYDYVGGITGYNTLVNNCYNIGTVTGNSRVGGVSGNCYGQVRYCYSTNAVTGVSHVGSVVGYKEFGFVLYCGTIDGSQIVTAGMSVECGGGGAQTLLTGLTSGTSTLLEALNAWVVDQNHNWNYTWKTDSGGTNGGYPILDTAYVPVYAVNAATNGVAANGVTAIATFGATPYAVGATATVTITLSGTATTAGTHTIGLTSAGDVGSVTAPATVTKTVAANATPTDTFQFTFTMPATAVDDLVVTNTFTAATVPGAPTIGTATAGNAQATVSFTPPVSNGGAAITGYTVTSNPGGITATGAGSPIIVSGLTNGTAYTFKVTATNSVGTSAASGASNSVTPQAPAPSGGGSYTPPALVTHIDNGGSTTGSNLGQLVSGGKTLTVDGDKGAKLVFNTEALKGIGNQTSGDIKVEMKDVSPAHQESLPGKQVFSLTVSSGSSTITNFGGAVTVTLPYTLKEGERANEVTVWYLASDGTMTEIPCTYDPATKLATFTVTHFSLYVVGVPWNNPFTDVRENDWFYGAVEFVSQNGMMKGIGGADFSPNTAVTRGMLVTILWRLENEPATTKTIAFSDVSDGNWYAKAVGWAAEKNIVTGYAGKFNPDDALTREQLAAILYRYAAYKNYNVSAVDRLSAYADKPSDWALSSVSWAVAKGLIKGSGSSLAPKGSATRAQTATILQRFIETTVK